jgi:hypothetical protein
VPCLICGAADTVRSHILPKALIHEIKEGAPHVVSGSRHRAGTRLSQGGNFDSNMLCAKHENATADLDRYGTEYLRRAEALFEAQRPTRSFEVSNPMPQTLRRFALSVVWREVHSANGQKSGLSLGPYEEDVRRAVFCTVDLPWTLLVSRTRFTLEDRRPVKFALHPFRVRFGGLSAWTFTAVGHSFWLISDRRGLPAAHNDFRADSRNPAVVVVGHEQDFRSVRILQNLLSSMLRRDDRQ